MKTAKQFYAGLPDYHPESNPDCIAALEARDREVRAAALREAERIARSFTDGIAARTSVIVAQGIGDRIAEMADRAERGE